jgi:hypothetical protein
MEGWVRSVSCSKQLSLKFLKHSVRPVHKISSAYGKASFTSDNFMDTPQSIKQGLSWIKRHADYKKISLQHTSSHDVITELTI